MSQLLIWHSTIHHRYWQQVGWLLFYMMVNLTTRFTECARIIQDENKCILFSYHKTSSTKLHEVMIWKNNNERWLQQYKHHHVLHKILNRYHFWEQHFKTLSKTLSFFSLILTKDTPYLAHEGKACNVLWEFIVYPALAIAKLYIILQ